MKHKCLLITIMLIGFTIIQSRAQLLEQNFSSSTTVSDYVSASPSNGQFNSIGTSGSGTVVSINTGGSNNKLRFARSGNAGNASRTTDFSPTPTSLMVRFDLTISGNSSSQTTAAIFYTGSGFSATNGTEANANVHSRIGVNWTSTAGEFSLRNIDATTNTSNFSGTQTITWVINNSGASLNYRAPDGTIESVADDRYDLWIGSTKSFNDNTATTATQSLTDFKFLFSNGTGTIDIDNLLIDPIPATPTTNAATSITSASFQANWNTVSGVTGYRVDVATNSSFTTMVSGYDNLYVAGQATSSVNVTGLLSNTPYWYRVRGASQYTVGEFASGNSNVQNPTTLSGSCSAPALSSSTSTSNITTQAADVEANVTSIGGGTAITTRGIEYSTNVSLAGASTNSETGTFTTGTFTRNLTGLTENSRYYYRGFATNNCTSPLTSYTHTSGYPSIYTLPPAPTGLNVTSLLSNGFTANWNPITTGTENETYTVEIHNNSSYTSLETSYTTPANATSQVVSGLTANTVYWYRVRANNTGGAGAWTNGGSVATVSNNSTIQAVSGSEATTISSLTNGVITNNTEGTQVWQFRLYDGNGTTDDADALPTNYTQWTIRQGSGNTVTNWSTVVNNVKFFAGSNSTPIPGSFVVSPSTISFTPSSPISVADGAGSNTLISMRLTLDNPLAPGSDGLRLVFELKTSDVTVQSSGSSQLATFTELSSSAQNTIGVLATALALNAPTDVPVNSAFSATVQAVDANGNVDTDNNSTITLSKTSGAGTFVGGGTQNLSSGSYTFTGLTYNLSGTFEITASGGGFTNVSASINATNEPFQLFDDFNRSGSNTVGIPSSGGTTPWTEFETGDGSRLRITNNRLVLSNCNLSPASGSNGVERASFDGTGKYSTTFGNAQDELHWLFNMQTNRSSPSGFSTSNTYGAAIVLGCDESDFFSTTADGYAVILGNTGSPDPVKLVRFSGGLRANTNVTDIVASTYTGETGHLSVKVIYNPCNNLWSLFVRNDGTNFVSPNTGSLGSAFTATNSTFTSTSLPYFGALWQHGSSCTDTLVVDNFFIPNSPAIVPNQKTWKGVTADWNNDNNWAPCGKPVSTSNVIVPLTSNNPVISAAPAGICNNITIQADAGITINANQFLNVRGNVLNNGLENFGSGTLSMEGTGSATIEGTITIGNVDIVKNVSFTAGSSLNIEESLELKSGIFDANDATVTLKSNASQTAYLDNFSGTNSGSYTGYITVERYVANTADGYRDISSPVSSVVGDLADDFTIFGADGVHCWYAYTPYPNVQYYIENSNSVTSDYYGGWWSKTGTGNAFVPMQGLAVRTYEGSPYVIDITGQPYDGSQSITITHTNTGTANADGWNFVGNPYCSPIDWNDILSLNTGINSSYYAFNTTGEYTGNWSSWNGITGVNGGTRNIASMQGFFIKKTTPGASIFTMNNSVREAEATTVFHKSETSVPDEIRLLLTGQGNSDEVVTYTDANATWNFDASFDAVKIPAGSTVYMSYKLVGQEYAINVIDEVTVNTELPLVLWAQDTGTYTFEAVGLNLNGLIAQLKDNAAGTLTDLTVGSGVSLHLNGGEVYEGRYSIVFKEEEQQPTAIVNVNKETIHIYSYRNRAVIEKPTTAKATITITNVLGQIIKDITTDSQRTIVELDNTTPWYAIVKVTENGTTRSGKVLIK